MVKACLVDGWEYVYRPKVQGGLEGGRAAWQFGICRARAKLLLLTFAIMAL
jgi:hypothetical protein